MLRQLGRLPDTLADYLGVKCQITHAKVEVSRLI